MVHSSPHPAYARRRGHSRALPPQSSGITADAGVNPVLGSEGEDRPSGRRLHQPAYPRHVDDQSRTTGTHRVMAPSTAAVAPGRDLNRPGYGAPVQSSTRQVQPSRADLASMPRLNFVPARRSDSNTHRQRQQLSAANGSPSAGSGTAATPQQPHSSPEHAPLVAPVESMDMLSFPFVTRNTPGLINMGNTCYANATLQALLHTPAVVYMARSHIPANRAGISSSSSGRGSSNGFCALCALQELVHKLLGVPPTWPLRVATSASQQQRLRSEMQQRSPPSSAIQPGQFTNGENLRQISRAFRSFQQEDAHEFLRCLMESATRCSVLGCGTPPPRRSELPLPRAREIRSDVHAACGGMLQSGVLCHSCKHESLTFEPFLDLSVGTAPTLQKALARFTTADVLDGENKYRCEACKRKVVASKRLAVRTAPNTLTIHLKRFDGLRKDKRDVRYTATLDLAPYMAQTPSTPVMYDLVAVLVHDGAGTRSGHYYSYVKGTNDVWSLKNDSISSNVPTARVLQQQAYILFYTRRQCPLDTVGSLSASRADPSRGGRDGDRAHRTGGDTGGTSGSRSSGTPDPGSRFSGSTRHASSASHDYHRSGGRRRDDAAPAVESTRQRSALNPAGAPKGAAGEQKCETPATAVPSSHVSATATALPVQQSSVGSRLPNGENGIARTRMNGHAGSRAQGGSTPLNPAVPPSSSSSSSDSEAESLKRFPASSPHLKSATMSAVASSTHSNATARSASSAASRDSTGSVRAFIVGGRRAVGRLARRILHYVSPASSSEEGLDDDNRARHRESPGANGFDIGSGAEETTNSTEESNDPLAPTDPLRASKSRFMPSPPFARSTRTTPRKQSSAGSRQTSQHANGSSMSKNTSAHNGMANALPITAGAKGAEQGPELPYGTVRDGHSPRSTGKKISRASSTPVVRHMGQEGSKSRDGDNGDGELSSLRRRQSSPWSRDHPTGAMSQKMIRKRRRAGDEADAEYDRGKPKRVRKGRAGAQARNGSVFEADGSMQRAASGPSSQNLFSPGTRARMRARKTRS